MARFRITLEYREPTYELFAGRKAEPFSGGSFEIVARDAVEALGIALARFDDQQRLSSVGWVREVVRVEIELLGAPGPRARERLGTLTSSPCRCR